jgi:hypothetical protein
MLLAGCTGGQPPEATPGEPIQFEFQAPDPPCPPPSALETPSIVDERSDPLFDPTRTVLAPTLTEGGDDFRMWCTYLRSRPAYAEDVYPNEHARISAQVGLYPTWEDSPNGQADSYVELPVGSGDLGDWERTAQVRGDPRVLREGCGPARACQEGEQPTVRSYELWWEFTGHVGNLDFPSVTIVYRVEQLPTDLEVDLQPKLVEIFRDFVLAIVDSYPRAEPSTQD